MKYHLLTFIEKLEDRTKHGYQKWRMLCDCGKEVIKDSHSVKSGGTKSCGCLRGEVETGMSVRNMPEYRVWIDMKTRCFNKNSWAYKYYGARGITVCDEWKNSFLTFLKDMGTREKGLTLDRKDNDGNYCASNCRWATRSEQIHNRGRS